MSARNDANWIISASTGVPDPRTSQILRKAGEAILNLVRDLEDAQNEIESLKRKV